MPTDDPPLVTKKVKVGKLGSQINKIQITFITTGDMVLHIE